MKRVANANARYYVQNHIEFKGSNTYGRWVTVGETPRYVVFSYGEHWPLFVYEGGKWYENANKFSHSTSRHYSQLHPLCETEKHSSDDMFRIANFGVVGFMREKLSQVS